MKSVKKINGLGNLHEMRTAERISVRLFMSFTRDALFSPNASRKGFQERGTRFFFTPFMLKALVGKVVQNTNF